MALHVFVIKEAELEDPQDLRAESGKCPNSTDERKNMSTKTLRKRIALVAVSALGAGLLSVVAVPSANAADITYANTSTIGVAGQVNIGITPSTTGSAVVGATTTLGVPNTMRSVGFVTKTSTSGTVLGTTAIQFGDNDSGGVNDTAGTLAVLPGAKIAWSATGAATQGVGVSAVLSGGATLSDIVSSADGNAVTATTLNGSSTIAWVNAPSAHVTHLGGVLNVSAAAGSTLNLSFYNGANVDGTSSATAGELLASITFTVVSASLQVFTQHLQAQ
jgi:trimeric autotransporter adhesin